MYTRSLDVAPPERTLFSGPSYKHAAPPEQSRGSLDSLPELTNDPRNYTNQHKGIFRDVSFDFVDRSSSSPA